MTGNRISDKLALRAALAALAVASLIGLPTNAAAAPPDPTVLSISASAAPTGATITIRGTGFGSPTSTSFVTFQGIRAVATRWTGSEIEAVVPERTLPGYVGVSVGNVTSNGIWFAPSARPTVTAISQNCAPSGTRVTLFGSGFGSVQRKGTVTFGGVSAPVSFWSDTRVVATVPTLNKPAYAGVWQNGVPSNGVLFSPFMPPTVTSMSDTTALAGDVVTVRGFRFGPVPTSRSALKLGGTTMTVDAWSDQAITFTVPPDAPSGYVGVVGADGVCSNGTYLSCGAKVSRLSRSTASPGDTVIVTGAGFGASQGTSQLRLGSQVLKPDEWTSSKITFTIPPDAPEGSYIGVFRDGVPSNGKRLLVQARLADVSDQSVQVGESVRLTGAGFGSTRSATTELRLGDRVIPHDTWSDTAVTFTVPDDASSAYLGVYRDGILSNGIMLFVGGNLESMSNWHASPGDDITLTGTGFGSTKDAVTFAGVPAEVKSWSDTAIVVTVPDAPEGFIGVWKGQGCSNGRWFLPLAQPVVAGPVDRTVSPGDLITVSGRHFGAKQGPTDDIKLGSVKLSVATWSDTQIVARIPVSAPELGVDYLAVVKKNVASNGWWMFLAPPTNP